MWELSRLGFALGCQFRSGAEASAAACAAEKRKLLWWAAADGSEPMRLRIGGEPPATPAAVYTQLLQRSGEQTWASAMFQVPLELARLVCGYRVDAAAQP